MNINHFDIVASFKDAIHNSIGCAPAHIEPEKLIRFGKNKTCYCKLYSHQAVPAGFYGDYRTGIRENWSFRDSNQSRLSRADYLAQKQQWEASARARIQQEQAKVKQAQDNAYADWFSASPASHAHPYLLKKQIQAHGVKQLGDKLIIPLVDFDGVLHSHQTIAPTGDKRFLAGGRKKGLFYVMGSEHLENEIAILCEGFATGASIFDYMHQGKRPVLVAFDAGNLLAVAEAYRARYPYTALHIYADDDRSKPVNTGLNAAEAVKRAVSNVQVFTPDFPPDAPLELSDFNDLMVFESRKAVAGVAA